MNIILEYLLLKKNDLGERSKFYRAKPRCEESSRISCEKRNGYKG